MSDPNKEKTGLGDLYTAMTGAGHGHDEQPIGPPQASVLNVGHEPDAFNVKPILNVPLFITIVMVATFISVGSIFYYFGGFSRAKENSVSGDAFNQTVTRISSTDPDAAIKQPRLEWIQIPEEQSKRNGEYDPPYMRSVRHAEEGNSPHLRPEDLRPDNFIDPTTRQKSLVDPTWLNKEKGIVRIPISDAMKITLNNLPVQANVSLPKNSVGLKPKLSNGGNEMPVLTAKDVPAKTSAEKNSKADHKDEVKKDDHNHDHKDEAKKDEHKKEEPKK